MADTIRQQFAGARKTLVQRLDATAPKKKSTRKGDDEKGKGGIRPIDEAARRTTVNLRRLARVLFEHGKVLIRYQPLVRQSPEATVLDHFWLDYWQNQSSPVADVAPDCSPANHLSPHL